MAGPLAIHLGTPLGTLLHASGPIDPTLWAWLSDKIDDVLGLSPGVVILVLGALIAAFPIIVMAIAVRRRRQLDGHNGQGD